MQGINRQFWVLFFFFLLVGILKYNSLARLFKCPVLALTDVRCVAPEFVGKTVAMLRVERCKLCVGVDFFDDIAHSLACAD